jgi:hypothetical protein
MTLDQDLNQHSPIIAIETGRPEFRSITTALPASDLGSIYLALVKRVLSLSLVAANVPVKTLTEEGGREEPFIHCWGGMEQGALVIWLKEDSREQAIEVVSRELEICFKRSLSPIERFFGIARFDWSEQIWKREFPLNSTAPFAPWLDFPAWLRERQEPGSDLWKFLGGIDV